MVKLLWRRGNCSCCARRSVISEVDAEQSSKALAYVRLLSGAMTLTRQVISSTSSPSLDGAVYVVPLGSFDTYWQCALALNSFYIWHPS